MVVKVIAFRSLEDTIKLLRKGQHVPAEMRRNAIGEAEAIKTLLLFQEEKELRN